MDLVSGGFTRRSSGPRPTTPLAYGRPTLSFICKSFFLFLLLFHLLNPPKLISHQDIESLHRYLMSRYDIKDYDDYLHVLSLYRNTRAIEAENALNRYQEIRAAVATIENARIDLLRRIDDRFAASTKT